MSEITARCRSCGFEQTGEPADCPVCFGPAGWWCQECSAWRDERFCAACASLIAIPGELHLGSFPPGSRVPVRILVRNRAKKTVSFSITSLHPALVVLPRILHVAGGGLEEVSGLINIGQLLPGEHGYRVRFETATRPETLLLVEVVAPIIRLAFSPSEIVLPNALPGATARRGATVTNTGNLPIIAILSCTAPWLEVLPSRLMLGPGMSVPVTIIARPRKTDCGLQTAMLRAATEEGHSWELPIQLHLPTPALSADAVAFGEVRAESPSYHSLVVRNTGSVRVACAFAADEAWLTVIPKRATIWPGKDKELKLRAVIPCEMAGPRAASVIVSHTGGELLRVPVSVLCRAPRAILAPIRRRSVGTVANDAPVVRRFRIANRGEDPLMCTISSSEPWIEVLTEKLKVKPGKKRRVEFRVLAPQLALGTHRATIHVRSNGGDAEVPVSVTIIDPQPKLEPLGDFDFGTIDPTEALIGRIAVRNSGIGLLKLRAEPESNLLSITPAELTLAPGPAAQLAVSVIARDLDGGPQAFGVSFISNGGMTHATIRFRIPLEQVDLPATLDLGDQPAGLSSHAVLRVRNTGPDPVVLSFQATDVWLRAERKRVRIPPGEEDSIPLHFHLPPDALGPITTRLRVAGRKFRRVISVSAIARSVQLEAPAVLDLGRMTTGKERAIRFAVANVGEWPVELHGSHVNGDLELWLFPHYLEPGETATVTGRVRMNARAIGREVRATFHLADLVSVALVARVARRMWPRIAAGIGGLSAWMAGSIAFFENRRHGMGMALLGLVIAAMILLIATVKPSRRTRVS